MADKSRRKAATPHFRLNPAAAAIMMTFAIPAAHAQSTEETALPEVEVTSTQEKTEGFRTDSTSAATRTETPLRDIPKYINTVPQELIRSQGAKSLVDALRNVPGNTYAAAEGGTQASQIFYMRGFPAGGDLFVDGVRDIGEYNRDLFNIESVEVLKGLSAMTFGRGSTGGVINQTTKAAGLNGLKEVGCEVVQAAVIESVARFRDSAEAARSVLRRMREQGHPINRRTSAGEARPATDAEVAEYVTTAWRGLNDAANPDAKPLRMLGVLN